MALGTDFNLKRRFRMGFRWLEQSPMA